jgi:hypothetical protein
MVENRINPEPPLNESAIIKCELINSTVFKIVRTAPKDIQREQTTEPLAKNG